MIEIKLKDFKIAIDKVVTKIKKTQLEIFENANTNVMDLYFYIGKIIYENSEYAILTNEIYKEWSGMKAIEYKSFKGLRKESLRDNMSDMKIALTDLGEITTRDIAKKEHPYGLDENINVAKRGGRVAKGARDFYEEETNMSAITKENNLTYKYVDDIKQINE